MSPKGKCRICGAKAPDMPCYECSILMFDRDNKYLSDEVRAKAAEELEKRGRMNDGQMS